MSESEEETIDLFQEPADWKPIEKEPTYEEYTLHSGVRLQLRLVGHNPLWVRFCLSSVTSMYLAGPSPFFVSQTVKH